MDIKQDVIIDLLPIYFDGTASDDSKELIDNYFELHPKFAQSMKKLHEQIKTNIEDDLGERIPAPIDPEQKLKTMQRTKLLLRLRTGFLISGILSLILPILFMTFVKESDAAAWAKYVVTGVLTFVMPATWVGYGYIRYRMRSSGDW